MKVRFYSGDFASSSDREVEMFESFEDKKGIVALKQYLVALGANLRQGNACAKDRGQVSGSGKKLYKQKGTGRARHGSKRSPIWTGGGVVFGPKPRDFSQKINKRIKKLALKRALFDKATSGELCLVDKLECLQPKTKLLSKILDDAFGHKSVLFVDGEFDSNFALASRNINRAYLVDSESLNAFDVLCYDSVVLSTAAMEVVSGRLSQDARGVIQ